MAPNHERSRALVAPRYYLAFRPTADGCVSMWKIPRVILRCGRLVAMRHNCTHRGSKLAAAHSAGGHRTAGFSSLVVGTANEWIFGYYLTNREFSPAPPQSQFVSQMDLFPMDLRCQAATAERFSQSATTIGVS